MSYHYGHPEIIPVGSEGAGPLFQGKRCFITGASSGIGFGLAQRLLQRGAAEIWICSRNAQRIEEAAGKLEEAGDRVHWRAVDVCDAGSLKAFMEEMAAGGAVDYVFANAGVSSAQSFEKSVRADFERMMEPNFYGVFNTDQAALPHMLRQGFGHILNMSSMEGFLASGYHSAYIASKAAVLGLTESLRYEFADRNIRFSAICPGPVVSNIWGRDARGEIHPEVQAPPDALTELQAADEILAGIEEGRAVILVTDTARTSWEKLRDAPESAARWAAGYTKATGRIAHWLEEQKASEEHA